MATSPSANDGWADREVDPRLSGGGTTDTSSSASLEDPEFHYGGFSTVELAGIGGVCVLLALISFLSNLSSPCCAPDTQVEMMRSGGRILLSTLTWGVTAVVIFWAAVLLRPRALGWGSVIGGHVVLAFVLTYLGALATDVVNLTMLTALPPPDPPDASIVEPVEVLTDLEFVGALGPYLLLLVVGLARFRYLRSQARQEQARQFKREAEQLRSQLTEARLESLRMQINPHFFHNTLHTISTMAGRDPDGIRRATARLSDLMRHVLSTSDQQEIALEEELDVLESYLDIQKLRLDERLEVTMDIEPAARAAMVPTLLLQPLAENAVKHGFEGRDEPGHLEIRARREENDLILEVRDNGGGLPEDSSITGADGEPSGLRTGDGSFGLENIAERLERLYGEAASLDFEQPDSGGLRVIVRVPFRTHEPDSDLRASGVVAE